MEKVKEFEEQIVDLLDGLVSEKRDGFLENDYILDLDIERVYGDSSYESEIYVMLKYGTDVVELYPIQVVLALRDEEPVIFVREDGLTGLMRDIEAEIDQWEAKYLARA